MPVWPGVQDGGGVESERSQGPLSQSRCQAMGLHWKYGEEQRENCKWMDHFCACFRRSFRRQLGLTTGKQQWKWGGQLGAHLRGPEEKLWRLLSPRLGQQR